MNRLATRLAIPLFACLEACGAEPSTLAEVPISPVVNGLDAAVGNGNANGNVAAAKPGDTSAVAVGGPEVVIERPEPSSCAPGTDADADGFTTEQGDCNDCDPLVNPGAYDFPGNAFDEDCSGQPADMSEAQCDKNLDLASTSAEDAARAIGLCKFSQEGSREWGVIRARFTTADGSGTLDSPLQVGLLPRFGAAAPRAGSSLLALSSGIARAADQPGYTAAISDRHKGVTHRPPAGFPKASSECPNIALDDASGVFNQAALELTIRVPTNAYSLGFDSIFYSYEYPDFICLPYNDFFITLLEPHAKGDGNIVFDSNGDSIGVNTALLDVCDPTRQAPNISKRFECKQGIDLLKGTGFGAGEYRDFGLFFTGPGKGGAATGWLTTLAPVGPGSVITLRFAIWDTADAELDSTVLIDRFTWSVVQPSAPVTKPTPVLL